MSLLEFARGPALHWALFIFVAGILWRLLGTLFLLRKRDLSRPKGSGLWLAGLRTVFNRSIVAKPYRRQTLYQVVLGYVFHIGLFIVIFLFVPHIEFFHAWLGLSWPGLPNGLVTIAGTLALVALVALLAKRLTSPVQKMISNADDYVSWLLTALPLATGLMAYAHLGPRYETMLALHILSVAALMIWFPFGKLMHAILVFPSRAEIGATYQRKGVKI